MRRNDPEAFQLELAGSILIRYSEAGDRAALERLAALDSRTVPEGSFLQAGYVRRHRATRAGGCATQLAADGLAGCASMTLGAR
jgi:hypothetical protein